MRKKFTKNPLLLDFKFDRVHQAMPICRGHMPRRDEEFYQIVTVL